MDVFVARQPIFDLRGEVYGYELLYRRSAQSRFADGDDSNRMSADVVIQSFLEVGLENITRGKSGFINFGREMLVSGCNELLSPSNIVVELLEDVPVDAEVIAACERLVAEGYRLALDDYVANGPQQPLLPYATIVKIDVLNRTGEEIREAIAPLAGKNVILLAEKVETPEIHDECKRAGFELFQGYFYSRPEILANRGVSVTQMSMIKLMNLLGDDEVSDQEIEEGFRRDASLSYKLLRMLSTAAQAGRGVDSILLAIRLLGRAPLQRWLALLLASSFTGVGGTDVELVHNAVFRGRFCELLGIRAGKARSGDALFLVGLFSLMDALLRTPMEMVVTRVDLSAPVREALMSREGPFADFLLLAEAYEAGEWERVTEVAPRLGLTNSDVSLIYIEAVDWSRDQVAVAA